MARVKKIKQKPYYQDVKSPWTIIEVLQGTRPGDPSHNQTRSATASKEKIPEGGRGDVRGMGEFERSRGVTPLTRGFSQFLEVVFYQ